MDEAVVQQDKMKDENVEDLSKEEVVNIELIYCKHCKRSYVPSTSKKLCQSFDENGIPKCLSLGTRKRQVFNSAKVSDTCFRC